MTGQSGYRVYSAHYSQAAPPMRRGELARREGPFFGLGILVVTVAVFIGGSAFGAQKLYDSQLAKNAHPAQAAAKEAAPAAAPASEKGTSPSPFAMSLTATPAAAAAPEPAAAPAPASAPIALANPLLARPASAVAAAEAAKLKKKLQARRGPAPATSASSADPGAATALPEGRGAVAAGPDAVPPNPF